MAVPKRRRTSSASRQRRMHQFITPAALVTCKKCGKAIRPHTVCPHCGYYKGKEVLNILGTLTKKEKKQKEREIREAETTQKQGANMSMEEMSKK